MALVDPNIALAVKPIELQDPMAQYGKLIAIQGAQQQNRLADMQMRQYELDQGNRNAMAAAYAQSIDPVTKKLDYNKLTDLLASGGQGAQIPAILKQRVEEEKAATEEAARRAKLMQDTFTMYRDLSGQIKSKADAAGFLQRVVNDPAMKDSPIARIPLMEQVQRIPEDPQGLDNWVKQFSLGATKYITENKPVTFSQDTGAGGRLMSRPGLGGAATVVPGSEFTKTATIGERTAQGQLNLAQQKFMWEKANPGFELKEDADGNFYGINKRTLQATPVIVGGTSPMATPAAPSAGMLGPRVPAPATQAIPGMPSVLDRPAAAPVVATPSVSSTAGTQLRGKKDIPAKFADTDMQLSGLAGSLKEFKNEVGKQLATGAKFLPTGADTARMQAKYTALLMGVKDLYTLGALAGPDMSIIESQLTNPASWSGKLTSQKGFEEQVKVIEDMLKRSANNLENTYGRQPKATKEALKSLESGLTGASATNPLGLPGL